MTRQRNYDEHARLNDLLLLGLTERADEQDIKHAYRELVKTRHPDRFAADDPERARAENEMKRINAAYTRLKLSKGRVRAPEGRPARERASEERRPAATPRATPTARAPRGPSVAEDAAAEQDEGDGEGVLSPWWRHAAVVGFLLAASGLFAWIAFSNYRLSHPILPQAPAGLVSAIPTAARTPVTRPPERAIQIGSENWHPLAREGMFAAGSTQAEVLKVQGQPSAVLGDNWFYGSSIVLFTAGRVSGYAIKDTPLKIGFDSPRTLATSFGLGSTKDEVLAVQGAPTFMEERSWGYGYSRIEFDENDQVSGFQVVDDPLKTRKP